MASCMIDGKQQDLSWKVWNEHNPNNPIVRNSGYLIHHINENHEDNRIENLQKITHGEHSRLHSTGRCHSEEAKEKVSKANSGRKITEEAKRKMSEAHKGKPSPMKGKHLSEELKQKLSEAHKGEKNHNYGKPRSEEFKRKLRENWAKRKQKKLLEKQKEVANVSC